MTKIALGNSDGSATELYATDYTYQLKQVGATRGSGYKYPLELRNNKTDLIAYRTSGGTFYRNGVSYGDILSTYNNLAQVNAMGWVLASDSNSGGYRLINDTGNRYFYSIGYPCLDDNGNVYFINTGSNLLTKANAQNVNTSVSKEYFDYGQNWRLGANENFLYMQRSTYFQRLNLSTGEIEKLPPLPKGNVSTVIKVLKNNDVLLAVNTKIYLYKNNEFYNFYEDPNYQIRQIIEDDNYIRITNYGWEIKDFIKIYKK